MIRTNPIHSPTYATESKPGDQLEDANGGEAGLLEDASAALTVGASDLTQKRGQGPSISRDNTKLGAL